jgi:hypothetical protein
MGVKEQPVSMGSEHMYLERKGRMQGRDLLTDYSSDNVSLMAVSFPFSIVASFAGSASTASLAGALAVAAASAASHSFWCVAHCLAKCNMQDTCFWMGLLSCACVLLPKTCLWQNISNDK